MHISKMYEIWVHTCHLILMGGMTLILDNVNILGTSAMNVHSATKINTLSSMHVLPHTSCIFSLILLWGEIRP